MSSYFNFFQDIQKQRNGCQTSTSLKLSNGYILPEGKMTPNTLFVGGIDMKVSSSNDFQTDWDTSSFNLLILSFLGGRERNPGLLCEIWCREGSENHHLPWRYLQRVSLKLVGATFIQKKCIPVNIVLWNNVTLWLCVVMDLFTSMKTSTSKPSLK